MKILICYHSQTGNTEKVARAMAEALEGEDVTVLPARKVKPDSIGDYDLALLGSGVYGAQVGEPIQKLVKKATAFPPRCALFWTHAYLDPSMSQKEPPFQGVRKCVENAGSTVVAEWDCQAENHLPKEVMAQNLWTQLPDEERKRSEDNYENIRGRPNEGDLENARAFARSLVSPE